MTTDKLLNSCRRIFSGLLFLYPKEYRLEYGPEMRRLFMDQCRATVIESGESGLLALWLRTFFDLCKTALVEHLSSPMSTAGLIQAPVDKPLPWKGVSLVLIPGLIFFICQIGTLNGKDWFFSIIPWLGYACMVPVLLVWIITKKFPIWGLVPLGLVIANIKWDLERQLYSLSLLFIVPLRNWLQPGTNKIIGDGELSVPLIFFILIIIMAWVVYHHQKFNRTVWLWLGFYALTVIVSLTMSVFGYLKSSTIMEAFIWSIRDISYADAAVFLLLVLLGALLARRHGKLAILLLVGYLLPTILYGYYETFTGGNTADIPPVWINTSVFIFRICLALLIPVWLARSASWRGQVLATIIPVTFALSAESGLHIARYFYFTAGGGWSPVGFAGDVFMRLMIPLASFILALAMYRSIQKAKTVTTLEETSSRAIEESYSEE